MSHDTYSTSDMRYRAVLAVASGQPLVQVAQAYGVNRTTLFRWTLRFSANGRTGLERQPGSGRPRLLAAFDMEALNDIVLEPASHFGYETDLWTVSRLRQVIREHHGLTVSHDTVWRRLREAGFTFQKPERRYFEASAEIRQEWMRTEAPMIRAEVQQFRALLYFQDEANVSLTAALGKTWAFQGQTPRQDGTGNRGGVSAMSALNGRGRLIFRLFARTIRSEEVMEFLGQMLKHHPHRHLVVVMDQAKPHTSGKTRTYISGQRRLHVHYLPKYSPDWNPDEKVWNHLKNHELKGHQAKTKEELITLTQTKLNTMSKTPTLLKGLYFRCCVADFFG